MSLFDPPSQSPLADALVVNEKLSPKQFCQMVLQSREFRDYIVNGIRIGDLPAPVILRLMDVGWGKPVDRIEVEDVTKPLEQASAEQLEARAMALAKMARKIRASESVKDESVH